MNTFLTDSGREVRLRAVSSRFVQQILSKHKAPQPPTYTVTIIGGSEQTFTHDEKSAEQLGAISEWEAYQQARIDAEAQKMQDLMAFLLYNCVDEEPAPIADWSVDFELWDLDPPDPADKKAFKLAWIEDELCPGPENLSRLTAKLFQVAGLLGEDAAREFESFFRLTLARLAAGRG